MILASVAIAATVDEVSAALTTCRAGTIESVPDLGQADVQPPSTGAVPPWGPPRTVWSAAR